MSVGEVRRFLLEFKEAVTVGHGVDLVPREASLLTLQFLGLTKQNLEEIVLALSVADYCAGPEADPVRGGEVWVFGHHIDSYEIYIKLKLAKVANTALPKCLSFHIAKHPLEYPNRSKPNP